MHGRSRIAIDPRIPTMPGRSTSGFHRDQKAMLEPCAERREVGGEGGGGGGVVVGSPKC